MTDTAVLKELLYRSAPMASFPLGPESQLIYLPLRRTAYLVPRQASAMLASWSQFSPAEPHFQHTGYDTARKELSVLADLGLLVSYDEALGAATKVTVCQPMAGIAWLAVPTCRRRAQVTKSLKSYLDNARKFGHRPAVLVADDASAAEDRDVTRTIAYGILRQYGTPVFYSGRDEKERYAESLMGDKEIPADVIRFAILGLPQAGYCVGANRNAILLHTLGTRILSVDDDTICQPGTVPEAEGLHTLRLGNHSELGQYWFFPNRDSALRYVSPLDVDVVAEHERYLGRALGPVLREAEECGGVDLDAMCVHLLKSLCCGQGRLAITMSGIIGDCGMDTNRTIRAYPEKATRERLNKSPESFAEALRSREVVRQPLAPTVSHPEPFMATSFGLDNRELLPPFTPVYRNSDGVFGHTLGCCVEHSYCLQMPWALLHAPPGCRSYRSQTMAAVYVSHVIIECLSSWTSGAVLRSTSDRMHSIGRHLMDLGRQPQGDFDETLRILLWRRASAMIAHLTSLCEADGSEFSPSAADIKRQIEEITDAVTSPQYILCVDLLDRVAADDVPQATRELVTRYGELLYWWPAIVERAKVLSAEGGPLPGERLV